MLGLRGCRLGITFPEITEMQAHAIFEAAVTVKKHGGDPHLEIMVPLVATIEEMRHQAAIIRRVAEQVFNKKGATVEYKVGTMIELPRAALVADKIAEEAEFFSFGTNDLTQTTFGISPRRHQQVPAGVPQARHLQTGSLRHPRPGRRRHAGEDGHRQGTQHPADLKVGICGEHGGDPESVKFCHKIGLNYVSCSPFRLLTARLAAAQAALLEKQTGPDLHNSTC